MILGVPRENYRAERRVAIVPAVVPALTKAGLEFLVEAAPAWKPAYPDQGLHRQRREARRGPRGNFSNCRHRRPGSMLRFKRPDGQSGLAR